MDDKCKHTRFASFVRHFEYLIRESKQKTSVTEEPGSSENQFQWILYINTYILLKLLLEMEE